MTFNMDDYVDVAERIEKFYEKYEDGSLRRAHDPRVMKVGDKTFILYTALAYRSADDKLPGMGTAWEPVPGPTSFTLDSEVMNAETAAWGRAIVACGLPTKKGVASRQEVQARQGNSSSPDLPTDPQLDLIGNLARDLKATGSDQELLRAYAGNLTRAKASGAIKALKGELEDVEAGAALLQLLEKAEAWQAKTPDVPADMEGLDEAPDEVPA